MPYIDGIYIPPPKDDIKERVDELLTYARDRGFTIKIIPTGNILNDGYPQVEIEINEFEKKYATPKSSGGFSG